MEYKENFLFYESYGKTYERLRQFNKAKADEYIYSIIRYGLYGELPPQESDVWIFGFDSVIATINSAKTNKAKKINIPENELRKHIEDGLSQDQIASIYNCSVDTIQRRMKEYGLKIYRKTANKPQETANRTENRKQTASSYNVNVNDNEEENKKEYGKTAASIGLMF